LIRLLERIESSEVIQTGFFKALENVDSVLLQSLLEKKSAFLTADNLRQALGRIQEMETFSTNRFEEIRTALQLKLNFLVRPKEEASEGETPPSSFARSAEELVQTRRGIKRRRLNATLEFDGE
ncbi:MAG: hypothetical protein WC371_02900, partial [Parachlamydiales bacterium]